MSELEDILNYLETTSLEPHDDYVSEFSYKDQKTLWKYIKELQQENQELKKKLKIKHDGFMASMDDVCEYAEENDKLRNVIDEAIYTLKDMQFQYEGLSDLDVVIKILEMEDKHE